jgi:MSHA pilin protein MshC
MKPKDSSIRLVANKPKQSTGFTLIELVMVIVILAIISVVVAPRFADNSTFKARGFADQVLATLRFAQKTAIAQHQNVCVALTASTLTLKIDASCATNLMLPDRQSNVLTAPSGISLSSTVSSLTFNALGQANSGVTITVSGITIPITVEAETGYVHQ